ncbi:hypothetical protein DPMN_169925 [Dreissena polymorpha]|uniref:Uncharacterized protein n=1 Tax=Dreissena polymorpha TaxID=45954 RepID=A0A9D4IE41_DREPO|nr:hypothetical protein DPMN_169925 [Dreissena polymorpha]
MNLLTKFQKDQTINVASRDKCPALWQQYFLSKHIIEFKLLTKFHEDWTINVASREKMTPPGGHVFLPIRTIFELFTCFHYIHQSPRRKTALPRPWRQCTNVTSRVEKPAPPPGGHETNFLTKVNEDWAKNVSSRLFTCFHYIHIEKTAPPPAGHVFQMITTIFELVRDIHKTNTKHVTSRENDPLLHDGHVFLRTRTIFELNHRMQRTNINAPPPGGHVFPPIMTIFVLVRNIFKIDVKTIFQDDSAKYATSSENDTLPRILPILTIFKLNRRIHATNILTKFHEDWTNYFTSRAFTCFHYKHIEKTAPLPGGQFF